MIQPYGYIPTIVMSCRCSAKEAIPPGKTSGRRSSSSPLEKKKKVLTTASILFFSSPHADPLLLNETTVDTAVSVFQAPRFPDTATFGHTTQPSRLRFPPREPVLLFNPATTLPA